MLLLLALMEVCAAPMTAISTPIAHGQATYYADGIMQQVITNRGLTPCTECVGAVALLDCDHIGQHVFIRWPETTDGPYLVADCAAAHHRAALLQRHWAVDVDRDTARRHNMRGPVQVTVFAAEANTCSK
jgi:hypothetical protein